MMHTLSKWQHLDFLSHLVAMGTLVLSLLIPRPKTVKISWELLRTRSSFHYLYCLLCRIVMMIMSLIFPISMLHYFFQTYYFPNLLFAFKACIIFSSVPLPPLSPLPVSCDHRVTYFPNLSLHLKLNLHIFQKIVQIKKKQRITIEKQAYPA